MDDAAHPKVTPPPGAIVGSGLDGAVPEPETPGLPVPHVTFSHEQSAVAMLGQLPHPILSKFNDEHIHKLLDNDQKDSDREDKRSRFETIALILVVVIVLVFVFAFSITFAEKHGDLVEKVLIGLGSFLGGVGTGLGAPRILQRYARDGEE